MIEITYSKNPESNIVCHTDCARKEICTNHKLAAGMRTEIDLTPQLNLQDEKVFCLSYYNVVSHKE